MKIFSKNTWGVDVNNAWPLTCKASCLKKIELRPLISGFDFALLEVRNLCVASRLDSETVLTDNGTNYLPTHDQYENNYCNNDEYKIPVRIQGTTEEIKSTNDDFFVGVSRKRSARFSLSGIDSKSTRTDI